MFVYILCHRLYNLSSSGYPSTSWRPGLTPWTRPWWRILATNIFTTGAVFRRRIHDNVYNISMTDVPRWRPWAPWRTSPTTTGSAAACTGSDYKLHHLSQATLPMSSLALGTARSPFKQSDIPTWETVLFPPRLVATYCAIFHKVDTWWLLSWLPYHQADAFHLGISDCFNVDRPCSWCHKIFVYHLYYFFAMPVATENV